MRLGSQIADGVQADVIIGATLQADPVAFVRSQVAAALRTGFETEPIQHFIPRSGEGTPGVTRSLDRGASGV